MFIWRVRKALVGDVGKQQFGVPEPVAGAGKREKMIRSVS